MKFNVKAFAWTCALCWGLGVFLLTCWVMAFEGATGETTWLGRIYIGYNISFPGALIGLAWGLLDGLIGGAIFAALYNFLNQKFAGRTSE